MEIDSDRTATGPGWHYGLALLLGIAIACAFLLAMMPGLYLYIDPDSSGYLESARNFAAIAAWPEWRDVEFAERICRPFCMRSALRVDIQ